MLWLLKYLMVNASYNIFGDDKILAVYGQAKMMRVSVELVEQLDEMTFIREVCDLGAGRLRSS